jgi:HNH endonuclease
MATAISSVDIKRVLLESGGICAFPGCKIALVVSSSEVEAGVVVAEIAHIVAASREGPRGDIPFNDQQRNCSDNLIVLCPTHHKVIDSQPYTYTVQVLQQMKADHLAEVRRKIQSSSQTQEHRQIVSETLHSSVLTVSHLPKIVYAAKCAFISGQEDQVRERIEWPQGREVLLPFVLHRGLLLCFQNLRRRQNPFHNVIDFSSITESDAEQMWSNPNEKRLYVQLLNRSLYKYAGHRDVRYDPEHRRFYFRAPHPGQPRTIQYKSVGGRKVTRQVVWQPVRRSTGETRNFWWHVAAGLRFHHVSSLQWCLSIRPEWHLTSDGETPLVGQRVGRRVTSKKSRMYNFQYLAEVNFWRDFLSEGSPRIVLQFGDQAAILPADIISINVKWPGIPNDVKHVDREARQDNLFSLAELHDVITGEDVEWDDEEVEIEDAGEDEF